MVSAVRKRNARYRYHRHRGRRPPVILVVAFLVALGIAAVVTAATNDSTGHGSGPATAAAHGRAHRVGAPARLGVSARRRRREARTISAALRYTPFIAAGTRRRRAIALSFDDGPSPYTSAIVSILVRMRVPATFFVVGQQLRDFSAGLRDELRHGFDVGDHTQNHAWLIRLNPAGQYAQIRNAAAGIERFGGPAPRLFRPPYGAYNRQTIATLRRMKMFMVLWSIDPSDWRRPGTGAIVANVLSNSKPGAIVIMHDGGGDRSQTVAALPAIIRGLRRRHYQLVTVPKLMMLDPPPRHQRLPRLTGA
jgi:peptidoglycan/xylan/chitin deacetylase (PgdA/CDA1 family)